LIAQDGKNVSSEKSHEIFEQTKQMRLEAVRANQRNKIRSGETVEAIKEAMSRIR
jgi:hypothetical protein